MELQKEYKAWLGFGHAVARLLVSDDGQKLSEGDRDNIKRLIGSSYDSWADSALWFWNWGMFDEALHRTISAQIADYDQFDSDGYSDQLYYYTAQKIPTTKGRVRRVLEVGSGSGAGLNFLSRFENQSEFVGVDLAKQVVQQANARFSRPGSIRYLNGDAEKIPFGDAEFDAVINVESSHNYPNLGAFFSEVERVLKPGGHFSMVDFYTDARYAETERCKAATPSLKWIEETDISEQVRAAIRKRMQSGSKFRTQVKKAAPLGTRFILEPNAMIQYGSHFIDQQPLLTKLAKGVTDGLRVAEQLSSYRHLLATKV